MNSIALTIALTFYFAKAGEIGEIASDEQHRLDFIAFDFD